MLKSATLVYREPTRGVAQIVAHLVLVLLLLTAGATAAEEEEARKPAETPDSARVALSGTERVKTYTRSDKTLLPELPACTTEGITDLVPMNLVLAAVRQRAAGRWDEYAVGDPIPCANDEGLLVCYQVPVALGTSEFPEVLAPPPAAEITELDLSNPDLWGVGQFWTFVVSSRYSDYPIFVHFQGLPPVLVTHSKALQAAKDILNVAGVNLERYVSRGHAGCYYVFQAPNGSEVTLDAYTLRQIDTRSKLQVTARPGDVRDERGRTYREQVNAAWDEIKAKANEGDAP